MRGVAELAGKGLHTGVRSTLRLRPAPEGIGLAFVRDDLGVAIPASIDNVRSIDHATVLGHGPAQIRTVEHVLAALTAYGISNAFVSVDGPEVPIFDGSAAPFVDLIAGAGILEQAAEQPCLEVTGTIRVADADGWVELRPCSSLLVDCTISFAEKAIGRQRHVYHADPAAFKTAIAPARTFGFLRERVELRGHGLAIGASLDNCIVVDGSRVLSGALRFADEFARHKILDLLGDLALLGLPIRAEVVTVRAGHALRLQALRELLARPDCHVVRTGEPASAPVRKFALAG